MARPADLSLVLPEEVEWDATGRYVSGKMIFGKNPRPFTYRGVEIHPNEVSTVLNSGEFSGSQLTPGAIWTKEDVLSLLDATLRKRVRGE